MNIEFLRSIGIFDAEPGKVLSELGQKEIELLDKRDLAETNGADERVKEIDEVLEKLKAEREQVKEDAKNYVPNKPEKPDVGQSSKEQSEKKKAAYEKVMQMKESREKSAQKEASSQNEAPAQNKANANNTNGSTQQNTASANPKNTGNAASSNASSNQPQTPKTDNNDGDLFKIFSQLGYNVFQPSPTSPQNQEAQANGTGEYSKGLRYYRNRDYVNAFKCFINAAESKSVADQTAEHERTHASYLLAVMYKDGIGTGKDIDRSNHYLKRAADFGYDKAQLEYGLLVLSQHKSTTDADLKARSEGWTYIEKAADAGLVDAAKRYIELAKTSADSNKHIINKAKKYIPVIKGQLDSYEAQKCDDWVKELNTVQKATRKKASYPVKYIIGEFLFIIGTIYLVKGLNHIFFEEMYPQAGKFIPNIPDFLIIKWNKLSTWTEPYMTHQGIFGVWLIISGNIIRRLGVKNAVKKQGKSKCKNLDTVGTIMIIALCVFHFVANIIETANFFGNGSYMQFLAMIGSIAIGNLVGFILFLIIK